MLAKELKTSDPKLRLVKPDLARDPKISVNWLKGNEGRNTLSQMGVPEKDITEPTLRGEISRVKDFIEKPSQLNWMIKFDNQIIGSIWVDIVEKYRTKPPSIHMMIGAPKFRRKGIGLIVMKTVLEYLVLQGYSKVYSRYLEENGGSAKLSKNLGFRKLGKTYVDNDELVWQNIIYRKS